MPEHPFDDYLLVNPDIKISQLNCDLPQKSFEALSGATETVRGKDGKRDKGGRTRTRGTERLGLPSQSWKYCGVAVVLQYRRGGNRPITRRLLICWAQTAAVLPPMRKPRFIQQVYMLRIPDRGFDPPWTHAGIFDRPWPSSFLFMLLFGSRRFSSSSSPCLNAHYQPAARTKHFLIGFRRRVMSVRFF